MRALLTGTSAPESPVEHSLSQAGHTCEHVSGTNDFIARCEHHNPDVVLVDTEAPNVDAILILKSVTETSPGTHRVVISANDDDRVVQSLFKAGAEAYLLKPVRELDLQNVLRKLRPTG